MTDKYKECFEYLALLLGAFTDRGLMILGDAIHYAYIEDYYHEPKSMYEAVSREIFITKAKSYYYRKNIQYLQNKDIKTLSEIRDWECREVAHLKAQIHPLDAAANLKKHS